MPDVLGLEVLTAITNEQSSRSLPAFQSKALLPFSD
jgi:hypothetical protein